MPRKSYRYRKPAKKRYNRRRKVYRRYRKYSQRTIVKKSFGAYGIPDRYYIKLKYCDHFTFPAASANGASTISYAGNSCFDPGNINDNHQAISLSQWAAFYESYRVVASKVVVDINATRSWAYAPGSTNSRVDYSVADLQYYVSLRPTDTLTNNGYSIEEQVVDPYCRYGIVSTVNGNKSAIRLKHYMTTKKILGLKSLSEDDDLVSAINSNPPNLWYWNMTATETDGTTAVNDPTHLEGLLVMTLYVELFGRKNLNMATGS